MITGSSMTENFKTSELDKLFLTHSIKVPYSGGTYKEIDESIQLAIKRNKKLKVVIRGLDLYMLFSEPDSYRTDLGTYPTYLYDDNIFNDYSYIFDTNIFYKDTLDAIYSALSGGKPSVTSFDEYCAWHQYCTFGKNSVLQDATILPVEFGDQPDISEELADTVRENVRKNITSTAIRNPNVDYYYFFTPYSAYYWYTVVSNKTFKIYCDAERIAIEEILNTTNIKLLSFNDCFDFTTDLNFYKDYIHYGKWINSFVLECMKNGKHRITLNNYENYLNSFYSFYENYDFTKIYDYDDYEDDNLAEECLAQLIEEGKI